MLIVELQEPTDLSIMLEWEGFGIDDEQAATLGLGWDARWPASSGPRGTPRALRGQRAAGRRRLVLAAEAEPYFSAQRGAPAGGSAQLPAGFAILVVIEGAGTLAGLDVTRGDAVLIPHAAGPVSADGDLVAIACRPPGVPAP